MRVSSSKPGLWYRPNPLTIRYSSIQFPSDMHKIIAIFILFSLLACKQDPARQEARPGSSGAVTTQQKPNQLTDQWIDLDFCSRVNQYGSVLETQKFSHKPYAYAYEFKADVPDSVYCADSERIWALPIAIKEDTVEIKDAHEGKSIFMVFNSGGEKDISTFDATSGRVKMDRYIRSNAGARDANVAFSAALNHHLFNGILVPNGSKDTILFTPGGYIQRWAPYDRYVVCAGGACFVASNNADIITMYNTKKPGSEKKFAFRFNPNRDSLYLHNLTMPSEGEASVGGVAYRFWRKPSN